MINSVLTSTLYYTGNTPLWILKNYQIKWLFFRWKLVSSQRCY